MLVINVYFVNCILISDGDIFLSMVKQINYFATLRNNYAYSLNSNNNKYFNNA